MTEVVDLTLTDSDTETQAGPSQQPLHQNDQPARQGLRTPLRKLLALRNGGQATDLAQPSHHPAPASPETIEILDSPEPPLRYATSNPAPNRPNQQQQKKKKKKSPAARAQKESLPSSPAAPRRLPAGGGVKIGVFDDEDYPQRPYEDQEWRPEESEPEAHAPTALTRGRKPKRTREEISREAALRKQQKAAETAARREANEYNSDKNVLKYFTVHLDPELIGSQIGVKICELFIETQKLAESERINYKVAPTGLSGLRAMKWMRRTPLEGAASAPASQEANEDVMIVAGVELVDQEEPHVMLCYEGEEFVAAVEEDELKSVFAKIESSCPGARLYILVHRLEYYLLKKEREDYQRTMKNGGGRAGGSRRLPQQPFNRRFIDDFVAKLAVRSPQVGFRDVGTVDQAAGHVLAHTKAIARRLIEKNDASKYLVGTARNKGTATIISSLLASNPINNPGTQAFMSALCALPCVGPQIAHALAVKFRSLGNLMEFLYDPSKSDTEKIKEIEHLPRTSNGNAGVRRIGPAAAKQLLQILMNEDADAGVHGE